MPIYTPITKYQLIESTFKNLAINKIFKASQIALEKNHCYLVLKFLGLWSSTRIHFVLQSFVIFFSFCLLFSFNYVNSMSSMISVRSMSPVSSWFVEFCDFHMTYRNHKTKLITYRIQRNHWSNWTHGTHIIHKGLRKLHIYWSPAALSCSWPF